MKKIIGAMCLLLSSSVFASDADILRKVLESSAVTTAAAEAHEEGCWILKHTELTGVYRCPGCFEFKITFSNAVSPRATGYKEKVITFATIKAGNELRTDRIIQD